MPAVLGFIKKAEAETTVILVLSYYTFLNFLFSLSLL
jgi:hypothetical protein